MKKKPKAPPTPPPAAPAHLSERSQILWREIIPRRGRSPERLALLQAALECLDRAAEARRVIADQGLTFTTKTGTVHVHPLLRVEKDSMAAFSRMWQQLNLARWWPIDRTEDDDSLSKYSDPFGGLLGIK